MTAGMKPKVNTGAAARSRLNSAVTAGGMLLQQVLGFVGGIFVAKLLGPSDYGEVSVLRSLLALVIVLTPLGLDLALFRILPRYDAQPHNQKLHFRRFRIVVFISGLIISAIGGFVVGPALAHGVYGYHDFTSHFALTLIAIPFATDLLLLTAWYRVQGNIIPILVLTFYLQPVLRTTLNVLAVYMGFGVGGVVVGTTAAYLVAFLIALPYHAWTLRDVSKRPAELATPPWKESWTQFREAPPMALNLFTYSVMRTADLAIVGSIASAHAVGEYAVVSNIAQLVPVAATALTQTLGPAIARHHQAGDNAGIASEINHVIRWSSMISSFVFGGIAGFGPHLDAIFGAAYHPGQAIVILIPLGYLMSATLAPAGYALSMCGKATRELAILAASAAVLVVTCIPLTIAFGTIGAAASVLCAYTFGNVVRLATVRRSLGHSLGRWSDCVPPVVALICAITINGALLSERTKLPGLFVACVVYAAVYSLAIFGASAFRWFRRGNHGSREVTR